MFDARTTPSRRIYLRFQTDATGEVLSPSNTHHPVIVNNVSVRGAMITTSMPLQEKEKIKISIQSALLKEPFVQKKAQVRWVSNIDENLWAIGLNFIFENIIKFH